MKKYLVHGTVVVSVTKEVWANNEWDAQSKAFDELSSLTEYCGNGGYDKLVGVDGSDESVSADGIIDWNEAEVLEDNPDYFECPNCGEECIQAVDGTWHCEECDRYFDEDGEEIEEDEEDEN